MQLLLGPAEILIGIVLCVTLGAGVSGALSRRRRAPPERVTAEARTKAIIESSLDAIVLADARSIVMEWNGPAEATFGWSAAEIIGQRLTDTIIPVRHREGHERGMAHYLATGEGPILNRRIEITGLRRDGSEFPVELTVVAAGSGSDPLFCSFIRDLTEPKRAETRRAVEHAVTRVIAGADRLDDAASRLLAELGTNLGWQFGTFWVVDPDEEVLRPLAVWSAPDFAPATFAETTRSSVFARGEGLPGRTWDGAKPVWVNDVQEDAAFPRVSAAAREGLHGAFALPVLDGPIVVAVIDFFHRDVLEPNDTMMEMAIAIGNDIGQSMRRMQAEEERDRAVADIASANGELQRTNAALEEQTEAAELARRLADEASRAKSEFLANMSHELRTPLNAILGYVDLLDLGIGGSLSDGQRAHLERVRVSGRHLLSLIEDILDISKVEAGRLALETTHARVVDVVGSAMALVSPQAGEKALLLESKCSDEALSYLADEDRVRQILVNLLSNAVKFTEAGGGVTIRCGESPGAEPSARLGGAGPWARIEVADTGIGIREEEHDAIFNPFVQAEQGRTRTRGGTGLGLTISRQLARLMGGDLTLESELGKGSRFTLWLPMVAQAEMVPELNEPNSSYAGLARIGELVQAHARMILDAAVAAMRVDPLIPVAAALSEPELEDHQLSLLVDIAQALVVMEGEAGAPALLRDGSDVRRLVSLRHGAARARQRWSETALRREFQIMRVEIDRIVAEAEQEGPTRMAATRLLDRLVSHAEQLSVQALHTASVTSPPDQDE